MGAAKLRTEAREVESREVQLHQVEVGGGVLGKDGMARCLCRSEVADGHDDMGPACLQHASRLRGDDDGRVRPDEEREEGAHPGSRLQIEVASRIQIGVGKAAAVAGMEHRLALLDLGPG